ncbi:unnamed protein product [Clonostachys rosea f. rosea IK726]|uniref:Uncharacterized protein n=1 Tax=Clonostachys rosea f. rosea IK726 TaxID=1349383 RepID=A0ACA9UUZ7_BIOOC|nr:unnamed protein product [Clonostachys rosea f. rosea IK726]
MAPPNWSRTGCITCKRRRKKCDRAQPACNSCEKRGIQCEGYQQVFITQSPWGYRRITEPRSKAKGRPSTTASDPTLRETASELARPSPSGKVNPQQEISWVHLVADPPTLSKNQGHPEHGPYQLATTETEALLTESSSSNALVAREGPADKNYNNDDVTCNVPTPEEQDKCTPPQEESLDLRSQEEDLTGHLDSLFSCTEDSSSGDVEMSNAIIDATLLLPTLSAFPNVTFENFYYLQYLDEQAATQLLNVDSGVFNPLRRLILPRALDCPGVLYGVCAVAACHQAQRSDPETRIDQNIVATRFYVKSVNWLQSTVGRQTVQLDSQCSSWDDASVITSLLLCKYEIIKGSSAHWRDHLDGLELLIQKKGGIHNLEVECAQYVASFLRYHRMIADICHLEKATNCQENNGLDVMATSTFSLDVYSGCAHHLLKTCHDIARLASRLESQEAVTYTDFAEAEARIISSLGTSIIKPEVQCLSDGTSISQISRLLYVAQRTRYAAFVFLHSVVERAIELCKFGDAERDALRLQIPYTKSQALDGCLEMLAEVPIAQHCEFAGLALAFFLAGCEVEDEHRKYLVLEKLFLIQRSFGLGHIASANEALMMIWQRDRGAKAQVWWNMMRDTGWELILC